MTTSPFDTYLNKIQADLKGGKATEHTYRSSLEYLLESLAPGVNASNDPKHIKAGAPDFIVERGKVPLGYVETKDVGEDLDKIEKSEQLKRYRASLTNLILTDYLEFRWYVNGAYRLTARIATIGKGKKLIPDAEGIEQATRLLDAFYQTETPIIGTSKELAERMAKLTHMVREIIIGWLGEESESGVFHRQFKAFQQYLVPNLTENEFADIYAQTMAYGLFAARINLPANKTFSRAEASLYLPKANPFLRKLFYDVGEELDDTPIAPFLDDLANLLNRAHIDEILADFNKRTHEEDAVVHFYQTFLAAYDPKLRKIRGVFYTPEPAVSFIVRSVDYLLKTIFKRPLGLADPNTDLLDPATGTATFLYFVIQLIYETQKTRGQLGTWQDYVRESLLKRIFGFELLMAPYTIAHLKLGLLLTELGYTFGKDERLGVYLTNTLEETVTRAETLGLAGYLSEEGAEAAVVRNKQPIMVVLGNPPYSGNSANKGDWISKLVRDYYFVDGAPLGERNPKMLQDDYVKFIRFAQWRIQQTGQGIVGFITNHGYLDNPTFRGMRQNLLATFDEIYVLDLHGNSKKKETAPDGGKDENVFDIQQGVAILLAVKRVETLHATSLPARVHHAHLWGKREHKYEFLSGNDVESERWKELHPTTPFYLFVPQDTDSKPEYESWQKVTDIFSVNSVSLVTHHDTFVFDFEERALRSKVTNLRGKASDEEIRQKFELRDTGTWTLAKARRQLENDKDWENKLTRCLYRPFDNRHFFYHDALVERPRHEVMNHLLRSNVALVTTRQITNLDFCNLLVSEFPVEFKCASPDRNCSTFPLYLYTTPEDTAGTLFSQTETTRTANLTPAFVQAFSEKLGLEFVPDGKGDLKKAFGPEDIFNYAYAVFHSPTYRTRYAEFLKIDFPRLPPTSDRKLFAKLAAKGEELVALHLMKSPTLDEFITTFSVKGSNTVVKAVYASKRVWINKEQYFGGVPEAVWEFKVGGYQVCDKWLKDRKGRTLSSEDIAHYQRIVVALKETIRLMKEIDAAITKWPME